MTRALLVVLALGVTSACHPRPSAPGTKAVRVGKSGAQLAPGAWFTHVQSEARAAGTTGSQVVALDAAGAGDRVVALVDLDPAVCALLLARGGPGVRDVDLSVYAEDGHVLASDEAPDAEPGVLLCPPLPSRVIVAARVAAGRGLVAVGAERVRPALAAGVRARFTKDQSQGSGAWPELEARLVARRRRIGGSWQEVRRDAVVLDSSLPTQVSVAVEAGRCLDLFAAPTDASLDVELEVATPDGRRLARGRREDGGFATVVCASGDTTLGVSLQPHDGVGLAALVVARSELGGAVGLAEGTVATVGPPLAPLDAQVGALTARLGPGKTIGRGALPIARRVRVPIALGAGCTRLDVLASAPSLGARAWLWHDDHLAAAASSAPTTLFACAGAAPGGTFRLDLEGTGAPGEYLVAAHLDVGADPALPSNEVAAARLLARADARGVAERASQLDHVAALDVSETTRASASLTLESGRCASVVAALGEGATGVDLAVLGPRAEDLARAEGRDAVDVELCATDAPLATRIEIFVGAGHTRALLAWRTRAAR